MGSHKISNNSKAASLEVESRFKRLVYGVSFGSIQLDKLRTSHLRKWVEDQLNTDGDEDDLRRSKNTANRNLAEVKAALNLALKDRLVATDAGWKTVAPFSKVTKRRTGDLTAEQRVPYCHTVTRTWLHGSRP